MSRKEQKNRRIAKHTAVIGGFILRLAGMAAFCFGVMGSAGYLEKGGKIPAAVGYFLAGLGVCVITAIFSTILDELAK